MDLTEKELTLLRVLSKKKNEVALKDLAAETKMDEDSLYWAASMLASKGFASIREIVEAYYRLTEEGSRYIKEDLPEVRLTEKAQSKVDLDELKKKLEKDELEFGLGWAIKKGFVKISSENGRKFLEATKAGIDELNSRRELSFLKRYLNEGATAISASEKAKEKEAEEKKQEFVKRGLIEEVKRKTVFVAITKKGLESLESVKEPVVTGLTKEIIARTRKGEKFQLKKYDLNAPVAPPLNAREHPFAYVANWVKEIFVGMGFEEEVYPVLETNFWNCDALFMPSHHPARGIHDIFFVKNKDKVEEKNKKVWNRVRREHLGHLDSKGWGEWDSNLAKKPILRSQTTAVSARVLSKLDEIPKKVFTIDLVYRPDEIDATHLPEFHQCEGIVVSKNANFRNLLGYIELIAKELGIEKVKFLPAFFPFTEPSVSGYIYHKKLGWIEALPGGIFRKEVTRGLGVKADVLAWGLGIDRLAMVALELTDIRELFSYNLDYLRAYPLPKFTSKI